MTREVSSRVFFFLLDGEVLGKAPLPIFKELNFASSFLFGRAIVFIHQDFLLCGDEGRVCDVHGAERTSVEGSRQCATDARPERSRTFEAWKHESTSRAFFSLDVHSTFFYTFANSYLLISFT